MKNPFRLWTLLFGLGLVAFASPHLIDDFLFGIPAEFGLTNPQAQILAGIFHTQLTFLFILVASGRRSGYVGMLFWAVFLFLAGLLRHVPEILKPEPYWSGTFSEVLILGMMFLCLGLAAAALQGIRAQREFM